MTIQTMQQQNTNSDNLPPDGVPEVVNDGADGFDNQSLHSNQPAPAANSPEREAASDMPAKFVDPRLSLAKRQQERRLAESSEWDGLEIRPPELVGGETDEDQGAVQRAAPSDSSPSQPKQATQQAQQQGGRSTLALKVNGLDMEVSREDALRYADIDPADAEFFTDAQIIKIAQKNYAAESFLQEAKAARNSARAASAGSPTPGQQQADQQQDGQSGQEQHQLTREKVVEALQFESPEVGAEMLDEYLDQRIAERLSGREQVSSINSIRDQVRGTIAQLETDHADIAADPDARAFAQQALLDEVARDLRGLNHPGLNEQTILALIATGNLQEAYIRARNDGLKLRAPEEIATAAIGRTRQLYRMPAPQQEQKQKQQQNGIGQRLDAKRGLIQQPNASSASNSFVRPGSVNVEQHRKNAIDARRAHARQVR